MCAWHMEKGDLGVEIREIKIRSLENKKWKNI